MTKLEEPKARTSMADGSEPQTPRTLAGTPRKGRIWPWVFVALVIVAVAGVIAYRLIWGGFWGGSKSATTGGKPGDAGGRPTPVVVATARQGDINLYLVGLGAVDPFNTVTLHSRVDGEITKVEFQEGQLVKKGDPLFEIDPRPYQAQLLQAQGQLDKDQAILTNAKLNVQRDKEAGTAIAAQQLSTDTATEQQTEGAIKVDQATIDSANLQVTYSHIVSPIDGRIGLRLVDQGNIVHATDTAGLAVITQLQPIALVFSLPEDDIPRVVKSMKQNPKLQVEAYDRDSKTHIASGTLLTIDNEVDPTSGTFKCKAEFENKDQTLFPSQFVNARLLVDTRENAVIVPAAGVQQGPDSTYVYVVQPDNTVALRPVTVTQLAGNEILVAKGVPSGVGEQSCIETGISAGDVIVTDGVDKLMQGAAVQISKPGAGTHGGAANASSSQPSSDAAASGDSRGDSQNAAGSTGGYHGHRPSSDPADQTSDQSSQGEHHHHRDASQ